MKKILYALAFCLSLSIIAPAQLRVAIVAGGQQSSVIEKNNLPNWDSIKGGYKGRGGAHFGFIADLPFKPNSNLSLQPGVIYYNKGRKYAQDFDSTISAKISQSATQYIDYIDIPINLVVKFGKRTKFIIGAGPYVSFFFSGKETNETLMTGGVFNADNNDDVPVGKGPGEYRVMNFGVNGLLGFESGRVFLTANYSRGLNDFYSAVNYNGSFKHQVIGATLGIFIGRPVVDKPIVADKDNDGVPDGMDECPDDPGTALTKGCPDKDGDGIADKNDKCPDKPGSLKYKGCPFVDTDKDGVEDSEDKCPAIAGVARYQGCPIPDRDKDGINDDEDKCPTEFGVARYAGCPVPDTDKDGVNDEEDKCPTVKGTSSNKGCPVKEIKKEIVEKVNFAARKILFQYAKANLLPESFKVLDNVVTILNQNPALKLSVEGHTSSDGPFQANMKLSQERADNVVKYLQSKGIEASRLKAQGFGSTKPLNKEETSAEKSQNRRVELILSN